MNLAHGLAEAIAVPLDVLLAQREIDARLEAATPTAPIDRPLPGDGETYDGIAEREEGDPGYGLTEMSGLATTFALGMRRKAARSEDRRGTPVRLANTDERGVPEPFTRCDTMPR